MRQTSRDAESGVGDENETAVTALVRGLAEIKVCLPRATSLYKNAAQDEVLAAIMQSHGECISNFVQHDTFFDAPGRSCLLG